MTRLVNGPARFRHEFLLGLTAAYPHLVKPVPGGGGVISTCAAEPGRVGVVIGGGAGHYPAFAGLVGPGLCDGAVVGEIFTSPSADAVYQCIKAADGGAGVLLSFGNYSGDVMHFGLAAQRARREGIDVRIVTVTDDVASAEPARRSARRGVAGGFFVFRAAASAAHAGLDLDQVEAAAVSVNALTYSIGVAFGGCTFPGATEPLFAVDPGTMAVGLGIHGEPGIDLVSAMPASEIARLMVDTLLAERPANADRARVLVNGLGATKYEELFVLFGSIAADLAQAGVDLVATEVGEYVTSLDMEGCSLTVCWTNDELEALLSSPASAPGFRHNGSPAAAGPSLAELAQTLTPRPARARASVAPSHEAARVATLLGVAADAIDAARDDLGRMDAVAGDGDHGLGMSRGMRAAATAAAEAGPEPADVLDAAGAAFADSAGGASGALWGAALCAVGHSLTQSATAADALRAGLTAVQDLGGAQVGDKTLVDAFAPFVEVFAACESSPERGWIAAAAAATEAAAATAGLAGRRGRAAVHGEHGIGTPDPGATSLAIAVEAVATELKKEKQ